MKVSAIVTVLIASFTFVAGAATSATCEAATPAKPTASVNAPKVAPERVTTLVTLPEVTGAHARHRLAFAEPVAR